MFSLNYITLIPFSCWFPAVFLVFNIQNYFTMCKFMNLLNDQIWTMLLDDALYVYKCIISIRGTGHNATFTFSLM